MSEAALRQRIERMGDGALAAMLGPNRDTYTDAAIQIATEIARERNVKPSEHAPDNAVERPEVAGVGGWLVSSPPPWCCGRLWE